VLDQDGNSLLVSAFGIHQVPRLFDRLTHSTKLIQELCLFSMMLGSSLRGLSVQLCQSPNTFRISIELSLKFVGGGLIAFRHGLGE
jgi:hypothetical protein